MNKKNENLILIFFLLVLFGAGTWVYMNYIPKPITQDRDMIREENDDLNNREPQDDVSFVKPENGSVNYVQAEVLIELPGEEAITVSRPSVNQSVTVDRSFFREEDDNPPFLKEESSLLRMCGDFRCYTSLEFLELYNDFESNQDLDFITKYIYQNDIADQYLRERAQERGYQSRGFARESDIVWFEGIQMRPEVRDAYIALRDEMLTDDIYLHLASGYRSSTSQRTIFKNKMGSIDIKQISTGIYDEKIDEVLAISAIPGYSKHHSGYAVDFGCGNEYLVYTFEQTNCYEWMGHNNFENIKKHGFIPSYPEGNLKQGPNPEPWEYVWVGKENIK